MEIKALCQTLSKAFDMSRATAKVSPKSLKEHDQDLVRKARSPIESLGGSRTCGQIEDCASDRSLRIILLRIDSEIVDKQDIKAIGW